MPVHAQVYLCTAAVDLLKRFDGQNGLVESVFRGPREVLEDYTGTLMADCWSGFESIELSSDAWIVRGACWSDERRERPTAIITATLNGGLPPVIPPTENSPPPRSPRLSFTCRWRTVTYNRAPWFAAATGVWLST